MNTKAWLYPVFLFFAAAFPLWGVLEVGDTFPDWSLNDQHDIPLAIEEETRLVIAAMDMASAKETNQLLEKKGQGYLDERNWVYLANIHGMPWIGRKFALPKMRKYPHRIGLLDSEEIEKMIPFEDGKITLFTLENGKIVSMERLLPEELEKR